MKVNIKLRSIGKMFAIANQVIDARFGLFLPAHAAASTLKLNAIKNTPESLFQPLTGRLDLRRHRRYARRQGPFYGSFTVVPPVGEGRTLTINLELPKGEGVYIVEGEE